MLRITSTFVLFVPILFPSVCGSSLPVSSATLKSAAIITEQNIHELQSAFDVVSIRPSGPQETDGFGTSEDQYHAVGPLQTLIMQAYFPPAFWLQDRLKSAPQWVANDRYTFVGKVAPSDSAAFQHARGSWGLTTDEPNIIQSMVRKALEDRCKLVVHRIPGEAEGLQLVVDRHGPNLKALVNAKSDDAIPVNASSIAGGGARVPMFSATSRKMAFYRTSMSALAAQLSLEWGTHVEDKTNLKGNYNFVLTPWGDDPNDPTGIFDFGSLGLKLERVKVPMDNLVIDNIERPSSN